MLRCGIYTSPPLRTPYSRLIGRILYSYCILPLTFCIQCRLFGRGSIVGIVLRAKTWAWVFERFTTSRAMSDDSCASPQSVTVCTHLMLCINTSCNGLNGAEQPKPLCVKIYPAPQPIFQMDGFEALNNSRWSTATALTPKRARCARCSAATSYRFALGDSRQQTVAALL